MSTKWTLPEYIKANPTESNYNIIKQFFPSVPDENSEDYTNDDNYNTLNEKITEYKSLLSQNKLPNAQLLNDLLSLGGISYLPEEKDSEPNTLITPSDKSDPLYANWTGSSSGSGMGNAIRTITEIGAYDVSSDIISINTSQITSVDEGNEQSTCTVVLNNNGQKYGKLIASYEWCPRITRIWSLALVDFNTGTSYTTRSYMIFTGFMSDAKYNEETAEISFGCVGIIGSASYDDDSWSTEDGYVRKMEDILTKIEEGSATGVKLKLVDLRSNTNVQLKNQYFAPSDISGSENLRSISQDSKISFYYATDWGGDETYVVLTDSSSKTLYVDLSDYVVNPGDCSTIFGHANLITTVGGTPIADRYMRHVPTPIRDEVQVVKTNPASIQRYGVIPAYINHASNLDRSQLDIEADLESDNYNQYIDRDIKVTVANIIPTLLTVVTFAVPDMQNGGLTFIYAGVRKKQVEFSASGLLAHIECARLTDSSEEISALYDDIKLITDGAKIGDNYWQFQWENGKWQPYVILGYNHSILQFAEKYEGEVPEDVQTYFESILKAIEDSNTIIDPNWRDLSYVA